MSVENEAATVLADQGCEECDAFGTLCKPTTSEFRCQCGEADRRSERQILAYGGEATRRMALGDWQGARRMFKLMATANAARSPEQVARLELARGLR